METIILPGMGADSRMYSAPFYRKLPGVQFIDWFQYRNEQTISDAAKRIIGQHNITEKHIVGGSSLGGIVAAEIANQIKIEKLILIGSTLTPINVNPILKALSKLANIAPVDLIQTFAGKVGQTLENELIEMFSKAESSFIRAMCKAIFEWKGNSEPHCEVCHIHGVKDNVIYPPKNGIELIKDGGHLIAITHSSIVSKFIGINTKKFPKKRDQAESRHTGYIEKS